MPESECRQCKELLVAPTDEALKKLELSHHANSERLLASFSRSGREIRKHDCFTFWVYDEGGVHHVGVRQYAHGKYSAEDSSVR